MGSRRLDIDIFAGETLSRTIAIKDPVLGGSFKGEWCSTTRYNNRDVVIFLGESYVAASSSQSIEPDSSPAQWNLLMPTDISSYTISASLKKNINDQSPLQIMSATIIGGGVDGVFEISVQSLDTAGLVGCYVYSVFAVDGSGDTKVIVNGDINVSRSVMA